jgi:hypothetical protein
MLADLFPSTIDENGILFVMITFTAVILLVVGLGIWFFARWSKKEKGRREREVNTAVNLKG